MNKPSAEPLSTPLPCQLWLIDLTQEPDPAVWRTCHAVEHARARRFVFERDARRYRAAHVAMRQTLAEALKVPADAIHWETGAHGKPHLQGFPGWHFNLSDSGDWALLALNQGVPIGVDLECHKDHLDTRSLAANHFSQAEQVALREAPSLVQTEMFLRIWSRKEACLKALGSGLSVAPESFEAGADEAELSTQVPVNGQACRMSVWSLDLPVNAQGAVALLHPQDTHLAL